MGSILKCKIEIRKETNASLPKRLGQYIYSTIFFSTYKEWTIDMHNVDELRSKIG